MYISHLLSPKKQGKGELLTSIIAPDPLVYTNMHQFQTKKIALADKILITEYQRRIQRKIINSPEIYLTKDSDFYITVHAQKLKKFNRMNFLMLPYNQRAKILLDILAAAISLIQIYGFFYLTESMVGFRVDGGPAVWISEDYFKNSPQFPLNHGRLNEEIFITDFKECFCGNFREMNEFKKARNIHSLRALLGKGHGIYSSSLLSDPIGKQSFISRQENLKFSYFIAPNGEKQNQQFNKQNLKGLKHSQSMNIFTRELNTEKAEDNNHNIEKKLIRTLSSPGQITANNPTFMNLEEDKIAFGRGSATNIPRINFTYSSGNEAWRRKIMNQNSNSETLYKSLKLKKNQHISQYSKQQLKVSFPHTTTNSFSPLASNGSINITTLKQITQQQTPQITERNSQSMILREIKSQVIDEIQNEFDNLFESNIEQQQSCENLEIIMEEFENILQA